MSYLEGNNGLGVGVHYGPFENSPFGANVVKFGNKRQIRFHIDDNTPTAAEPNDSAIPMVLPKGSYVTGTYVYVTTASGTTTETLDAIGADGTGTATLLTFATPTDGTWVAETTAVSITEDSELALSAAISGAEMEVIIEYFTV